MYLLDHFQNGGTYVVFLNLYLCSLDLQYLTHFGLNILLNFAHISEGRKMVAIMKKV